MGMTTKISWTDSTFNPWIGCTKVSAGCARCYAMTMDKRYHWTSAGWGPGKPRKKTSPVNWRLPMNWADKADRQGIRKRVFCASLADVFDPDVPNEWRNELWDLIASVEARHPHTLEWLILTKRPEVIIPFFPEEWRISPPSFIRLGISAEDHLSLLHRLPALLRAWRGKNFISYEPALGPIYLSGWMHDFEISRDENGKDLGSGSGGSAISWVICGGDSGPGCRPMSLEWARDARDQCAAAGVPFFMKQLGGHPNKQDDPGAWPEDLRIQQFPD
jgi:protein gp37